MKFPILGIRKSKVMSNYQELQDEERANQDNSWVRAHVISKFDRTRAGCRRRIATTIFKSSPIMCETLSSTTSAAPELRPKRLQFPLLVSAFLESIQSTVPSQNYAHDLVLQDREPRYAEINSTLKTLTNLCLVSLALACMPHIHLMGARSCHLLVASP